MKKIIITSALTAVLTAVVVSLGQDQKGTLPEFTPDEHIQFSPSPNGEVDRYEIIAAKVTQVIYDKGENYESSKEVSYVIRLDKFTGRAWYYSIFCNLSENVIHDIWQPIKY